MRKLRAARFVTDFDSSVNMVRALGRFFEGKDHRGLSIGPGSRRLANLASSPPGAHRRRSFVAMGAAQGIPLDRARVIDAEEIAHWVAARYGRGPFDAVVLGSASGAGLHLAAALGAPFLPQTTLVAVRDFATHPDEPVAAMETLACVTRLIARNNPEVSVYHMHDPAQDRPMLQRMAYMRLKRLRLGRAYERFLEERLAPGATVVQLICTRTWRTRTVGERAYFQFGALGGVAEDEYHDPGERIARYLEAEGSPRRDWEPPETDARRPEAEWGWDPALGEDVERLARRYGFSLRCLAMEEPDDLSPFVADFHRWWYRRMGVPSSRLLVESYVQWDPYWVLRLGVVPFWLRFNMEPSYEALGSYLDHTEAYDDIYLNLFSQGLWSPGVVPVQRWRELIESKAREHAAVIGVDEDAYPIDTGSTLRYQPAFEALPFRSPIPPPVSPETLDLFLADSGVEYPRVRWT
ncbi:MAG TPA: hypothetical protein VK975_02010 [Acidimicrobiales bacterium]|nr:hypothetical protein [Acidimicrobiales bacterium]